MLLNQTYPKDKMILRFTVEKGPFAKTYQKHVANWTASNKVRNHLDEFHITLFLINSSLLFALSHFERGKYLRLTKLNNREMERRTHTNIQKDAQIALHLTLFFFRPFSLFSQDKYAGVEVTMQGSESLLQTRANAFKAFDGTKASHLLRFSSSAYLSEHTAIVRLVNMVIEEALSTFLFVIILSFFFCMAVLVVNSS
jgi:hypothetical protein